jgi:2,3-bisphosphoglycerate-dependent phosphoglycerate mutase
MIILPQILARRATIFGMSISGKLILLRHTETTDNFRGVWSGMRNVSLTEKGRADAEKFGQLLSSINFDVIYVSQLKRSTQTLKWFLKSYGKTRAKIKKSGAFDERDYGKLAGHDKWLVRAQIGVRDWMDIRRGWDTPIPNGETLRDTYERTVPWYREIIVPQLLAGKNIMIVGHGNSGRALRKYIERINDVAIRRIEMDFDQVRIYEVNEFGYATNCKVRRIKTGKTLRY